VQMPLGGIPDQSVTILLPPAKADLFPGALVGELFHVVDLLGMAASRLPVFVNVLAIHWKATGVPKRFGTSPNTQRR
jgi:hypothetical protein